MKKVVIIICGLFFSVNALAQDIIGGPCQTIEESDAFVLTCQKVGRFFANTFRFSKQNFQNRYEAAVFCTKDLRAAYLMPLSAFELIIYFGGIKMSTPGLSNISDSLKLPTLCVNSSTVNDIVGLSKNAN